MQNLLAKHTSMTIAICLAILSVASWAVLYNLGLTTIYNDAMSHLNIGRQVIDNIQPGFSQLGSVWLPMSHVLELLFIWNGTLWHTGLAGSLISMASFVAGGVAVYKTVDYLSGSELGSVLAAATYGLNMNLLYLQSTPLTEPLYIALFLLSGLYLVKYLKFNSTKSLIPLAFFSAIGILTRYDAWFVAAVIGLIILVNELWFQKHSFKVAFGYFTLYAFPIIFAAMLWFGWNLLIFGDPLYAFTGPYSARAQQAVIDASSGLITKNSFLISGRAYWLSVIANIGLIVTLLGIIGWIVYLTWSRIDHFKVRLFAFVALFSIIAFNVTALILGFSILNLPALGWNPSGRVAGELFNVRYGVLALPFVAVGVGLLFAQLRRIRSAAAVAIIIVLLLQAGYLYRTGIITIRDGQIGSSAFVNQDIAQAIKNNVKPGERVIMSTSSYNAVAFRSGLDLDNFIHEGVSQLWNGAITQPDRYAKWVVMANNDVGEPVYESLVKKERKAFLTRYTKTFSGTYAGLYERN